ncbi:conserved hypothetical protein [Candidatus Accumulibacter aalborgensis]|uniref:DUF927 domain-containing protein n=1 Tax=Candidatus Accumulibacter aalborgensis TaxID=1860102 RepID=A0A1A8XTM9_9PROT|nr:DUF927 domain-containing protein [Candidatus Accumulibacter aalborgensis]SBT08101.1 conserved hypothetical protein [Candidatus Accumulibacter aalborgensis]
MAGNDRFKPVAAAALARFDAVMDILGLAGGKNAGREYLPLNPRRDDHKPGSFSIHRDKGAWLEGATGDKGGDLISLAAYVRSCSNAEAAEWLGQQLGVDVPARQPRARRDEKAVGDTPAPLAPEKPASEARKPNAGADDGVCVMPIPDEAPPAPALHPKHGKPAGRWVYVDLSGAVMFHHCRFEPAGERKQFAPLSLWRMASGRLLWKWKAPSEPRPLLGLDRLASLPAAPVVVVEGEKAHDAAALLLPDVAVVTWQGGCNAVDKADWLPLAGRVVWLWPDADEAGAKAMQKVEKRLQESGATEVQRVNLGALAMVASDADGKPELTPGEPLAAGDDAADLIDRGWRAAHLALLIDAGTLLSGVTGKTPAAIEAAPVENDAATGKDHSPRRGFRLDERGVWFVDVKEGVQAAPRWISSPLDILASVRDEHSNGWGLWVGFEDPDGRPHREIIPARTFNGEGLEASALLFDRGLKIAPRGRPLLIEYLQTANPKKRARVTNRTGWHDSDDGGAFVLPDRAFGRGGEEWIFESDSPDGNTYRQKGSLAEWKEGVARRCVGNSRLVFAVCMAFAAPLLHLVGAESGGFHLRSQSSDGKTMALRVAASVCGSERYMQRWRATANGLEALAMQYCDAPLLLDELAQLDAREAGEVAYMLANGSGKARAGRTGVMRSRSYWRLMFLSSGEIGLAQHMAEVGKQSRAGQELRLAEIPADAGKGLGLFENLHESASGADFAKAIDHATRKHYGSAWVDWLKRLVSEPAASFSSDVHGGVRAFERQFLTDAASGQARRVAGRFALVGVAGELATQWGMSGWKEGEAMKGVGACFMAWLANRGGEGNHEERVMLRQIREFLSRYGESAFTDWERPSMTDTHAPVRSDRAGWRKHDSTTDKVHYFVAYEAWRVRVCKGHDPIAMARLLLAHGFAEKGTEANRPWLVRASVPGEGRPRVVHILPEIMEADDD